MFGEGRLTNRELIENLDLSMDSLTKRIYNLSTKYGNAPISQRMKRKMMREVFDCVIKYQNARINAKKVDLYVRDNDNIICESLIRLKINQSPISYQGLDEIISGEAA